MNEERRDDRLPRIFHGPVNIGGNGRYHADWQRKQNATSDFIVYDDETPQQNHHYNLRARSYPRVIGAMIMVFTFLLCLVKYDIFHFYFGTTLLPWGLDLPILRLFGKKLVMTYAGSDIRLMELEQTRNPYAHLLRSPLNDPGRDRWKKRRMRWQNLWIHRFFAIREIYDFARTSIPERKVIRDIWVNNMVDLTRDAPDFTTKDVPVLIHAPTNPAVKGSRHVEEAVAALRDEGHEFRFVRLEGVPHEEAELRYRHEADIIVDQFYAGGFGQLAVEGMSFGKPVCCYLTDSFREQFPDCPVVSCTIDDLKEKLAWLIENPQERIRLGREGRSFVEKHCDYEKINRQLWEIYAELMRRESAGPSNRAPAVTRTTGEESPTRTPP